MSEAEIIRGSNNVFADLGFENPDEMLAKADVINRIKLVIESRGLTQAEAASLAGMKPPHLSRLLRGGFYAVTFDKLFVILRALGVDIGITLAAPGDLPHSAAQRGDLRVIA